jgi:hypothetical protein
MNQAQDERRARMLEKVRKLLSMGRDGRGNETEQETAMRQANKLMAEWGIAEAECDMAQINAGEMSFGETQCGPDGRAPAEGKVYRSLPSYAGILCVGVARFTDSIVIGRNGPNGKMLVFCGEKNDVLFARWVFGVLVDSINVEQRKSGWTKRGEASSFRVAAASTIAKRLKELAAERRAMYQQAQATSNSRALVVVDRKAAIVAERFGRQQTRSTRSGYTSSGAAQAGHAAGSRINIPSGRPLGQANHARLGSQ